MAELLGTDQRGCRVGRSGRPGKLQVWAKAQGLRFWAIYRSHTMGGPFHNATDERYLLWHHQDPYWLNRGVPSDKKLKMMMT